MNIINILIVEDDLAICKNFKDSIKKYNYLNIIKITKSAPEASLLIDSLKPDVLILDLELDNGIGNGMDILYDIYAKKIHHKPFILVTTNSNDQFVSQCTQNFGADYTLKKYQENYSEATVLQIIHKSMTKDFIQSSNLNNESNTDMDNTSLINHYSQRLFDELNKLGLPTQNLAYQYFYDAILYRTLEPLSNYMDMLSQKYNKTEDSIKKAMQRSINTTWSRQPVELLADCYTAYTNSSKGTPTIHAFILYYASKIKLI